MKGQEQVKLKLIVNVRINNLKLDGSQSKRGF